MGEQTHPDCTSFSGKNLYLSAPAVRQMLAAVAAARVLSVAVDYHKNVNVVLAVDGCWRVVQAQTALPALGEGLAWLTARLDTWLSSGAYDLVLLTHEPTGVYHEAWLHALLEQYQAYLAADSQPRLLYRWQHTEAVKLERRQTYHRPRKTDEIDLWAMTTLNLRGEGQSPLWRQGNDLALNLAIGRLRRLVRQQQRLGHHLQQCLDRLWPGALGNARRFHQAWPTLPPLQLLVGSRPLERERVRLLLQHCANPHEIAALGVEGLVAFYRQHGLRCGRATARQVQQVFTQAVLPPPALAQPLAEQVQQDFATYLSWEAQIGHLENETIAALLPDSPAAVLLSVPGVSLVLAGRYLAGILTWQRFPSANHIWSYAGFDPTLDISGNRRRVYTISRQGSAYLRDTLFHLGYQMALHCPPVTKVFVQALARGMTAVGACIHAAHKGNRLLYALLRDQTPYTCPLTPADVAHWQAQLAAHQARQRRRSPQDG